MPGIIYDPMSRIVQQLLQDLDLAVDYNGTADEWPAFIGVQPPSPNNVITVYDTEGIKQGRVMIDGEVQDKAGVQIRIRAEGPVDGYVKGRAILNGFDKSVDRNTVIVGSNQYVINSMSRQTDVLSLGLEEGTGRLYLHTLNYTVSYRYLGSVGTGS